MSTIIIMGCKIRVAEKKDLLTVRWLIEYSVSEAKIDETFFIPGAL